MDRKKSEQLMIEGFFEWVKNNHPDDYNDVKFFYEKMMANKLSSFRINIY